METISNTKVEVASPVSRAESRPLFGLDQSWVYRFGGLLLLLTSGLLLGVSIATEKWVFVLAAAALPLLFFWPIPLTLGAFAFLVPFDVVSVLGNGREGTTLTFVVGGTAAVVLLVVTYLRQRLERPQKAAFWWLLFMILSAASTLWALDPSRTLTRLPTATALVLFFVVAASSRITEKELSWVILATMAGGCVAGAYCVRQYLGGHFYGSVTSGRSSLTLGEGSVDPNMFAASLFLPLSLAMGSFFVTKGWVRRGLSVGAVLLMGAGIFVTMSRGAVLGLVLMVFIYIRRIGLNRRIPIAAVLMVLALLPMYDRLVARVETAELSGGSGRLYVWPVGLAAMKHLGFYGAGLDNFRVAYTTYLGEGGTNQIYSFQEADAHNIYLSIAVELGIGGLAIMLMAFIATMRSARQAHADKADTLTTWIVPYEAAAWAMLLSSFFVGMMWQKSFWLLWILFALAIRVATHHRQQPSPNYSGETFRSSTTRSTLHETLLSPRSSAGLAGRKF
jgi:O-antigen ligase